MITFRKSSHIVLHPLRFASLSIRHLLCFGICVLSIHHSIQIRVRMLWWNQIFKHAYRLLCAINTNRMSMEPKEPAREVRLKAQSDNNFHNTFFLNALLSLCCCKRERQNGERKKYSRVRMHVWATNVAVAVAKYSFRRSSFHNAKKMKEKRMLVTGASYSIRFVFDSFVLFVFISILSALHKKIHCSMPSTLFFLC